MLIPTSVLLQYLTSPAVQSWWYGPMPDMWIRKLYLTDKNTFLHPFTEFGI